MRDSPSLTIIPALQDAGARITAYDPQGMKPAAAVLKNINYVNDPYEAIEGKDALVIITEWDQFRALDLKRVKQALNKPVIIDLRNMYDPHEMAALGFSYTSIGRPTLEAGRE